MQLKDTPVDFVYKGISGLVEFGIPLQKGRVWHTRHVDLFLENDELHCQITPVGFWDDDSIRWLKVTTVIVKSGRLRININNNANLTQSEYFTDQTLSYLHANTLYQHQHLPISILVELKLAEHNVALGLTSTVSKKASNELTNDYELSGKFVLHNKTLHLSCNIQESKLSAEINAEVRLHNPSAAAHLGGKWDLGDKNSIIIDDFSIIFECKGLLTSLLLADNKTSNEAKIVETKNFTLAQFGSGGVHWQSPIHWNENKISTVAKQGFELHCDTGEIKTGLRAEPTLILSNKDSSIQVALDRFWQNFPVELSVQGDKNRWQLLGDKTELQGGESKTWRLKCRTENQKGIVGRANLLNEYSVPEVKFNTDYINQCQILPHVALSTKPSNLFPFINKAIEGKQSFFNKREKNDVYGWRNYGELDADHEAVNAPANTYFISHYNNQYDPLMGMTLQYLHSANPKWLELIHPLNQHIQDIDIYDTTQDKAEYNGGLMWHTDHYLSAETSTHRSNSKYHKAAYEGFLGGGGPGGQHCYTTGLALQYRLFADESAKAKVIQLCNWIRFFYKGSGSIAERTFRLLTIDFKQNVLTNIGIKAAGYKYPLDRGTGNYLTALLDCFDVTENAELLKEMGQLVRSTFHPNENIDLRDLKNIEKSWFYTVYLQAVVKYLLLKETRDLIDEDYWYARQALMHYGEWMLSNESFYLSNADQLEFPNDTWCAQDTRKMNLFCYFYYFDNTEKKDYLLKANEYYRYIVAHMKRSDEAHFTRILALLMQNDGVTQKFGLDDPEISPPRSPITFQEKDFNDAPSFSRYTILKTYLKDVTKLLLHFSPKSEWKWLSLRVKSVLNK